MIRKLVLLTALTCFTTLNAYGVGLGELQLNSALNQSFDAVIALVNEEKLIPDEIRPSLASQADFDRLGIERSDVLTDLRFVVDQSADGTTRILVSSRKPIIEPYLNFLVEVLWPNGRLLREYTVLLDPPVFGVEGVQPIEVTPSVSTGSATAGPAPTQRQVARSKAAGSTATGSPGKGEYGMTGPGDTLWSIAASVRPDGVSVQQTMLAIQRANPEAFIDNNINLLKAGHVLRIPDAGAIQKESAEAAIELVKKQNEAWEEIKGGEGRVAQLDASSHTPVTAEASDDGEGGELKLLSTSSREGKRAGAGAEDSARVSELENDLAVAMEDLDRTRRANTDLNIRLDDLAGQIETLNQLVQLKDDQLAELQKQLKQVQALAAQATMTDFDEPVVEESSILGSPLLLGGIGLLVVLGIAAGLYVVRRRKAEDEDELDDDFNQLDMGTADETSVMAVGAEAGQVPESAEAEQDSGDDDVSQQTEDVISEADIYIAYGRFPQAITFLKNAVGAEPDRTDIKLKLLEVYAQTKDNSEFNLLMEQLKASGDDQAIERGLALQASLPGAAEEAAAAMGATVISSEPVSAIAEPEEDDDLSFDLDDLDSETDDELDLDGLDLDDASLELDIADSEADQLDQGDTEDLDLDLDLGGAGDTAEDLPDSADTQVLEGLELELDDTESSEPDLELDDIDLESTLADDTLDDDLAAEAAADDDLDLDAELDLDDLDLGDDLDLEDTVKESDDDLTDDFDLDTDDELDLDADADELDLDSGEEDIALDEAELDLDLDDEFNLDDDDISLDDDLDLEAESSSKLDLARAYIDMGDTEGARSILTEVAQSGSDAEKQEANELMSRL